MTEQQQKEHVTQLINTLYSRAGIRAQFRGEVNEDVAAVVGDLLTNVRGQIQLLLALVCLLYLMLGDKSGFYSSNGNIQLYTADTGAIGKTYHYFSYLCRGKYGFYTEVPISREDWLGQFSFQQNGSQLVITQHDDSKTKTIIRQIPAGSCDQ